MFIFINFEQFVNPSVRRLRNLGNKASNMENLNMLTSDQAEPSVSDFLINFKFNLRFVFRLRIFPMFVINNCACGKPFQGSAFINTARV